MQGFFASSTQKAVNIQKAFVCGIFGLQRTRLDFWYVLGKKKQQTTAFVTVGERNPRLVKSFSKFIFTDVLVMTVWQLKLNMPVSSIGIFPSHNKVEDIFLSKPYFAFSTISCQ